METAVNRLARYRRKALNFKQTNPEALHYHDWRSWMSRTIKAKRTSRDEENAQILYVEDLDSLNWRREGDSHEIVRLNHTGWYADSYQQNLVVGCVLQLPTRKGRLQFVPATYNSEWDTATVYLNEITDDNSSAARWADQNAEKEAERSREYEARDEAALKICEAREAIHTINKEVLPALKELKVTTLSPALCTMVRAGIIELLCDRRSQFSTIKKLEDDFWQAVPQ